jgi:hypothetical protein
VTWVSSTGIKSISLELITRGLHERDLIFKTNPIYGGLSLLGQKPTAPLLVLTEKSARSERKRFYSNYLHGKEELKTQQ